MGTEAKRDRSRQAVLLEERGESHMRMEPAARIVLRSDVDNEENEERQPGKADPSGTRLRTAPPDMKDLDLDSGPELPFTD